MICTLVNLAITKSIIFLYKKLINKRKRVIQSYPLYVQVDTSWIDWHSWHLTEQHHMKVHLHL